MTNQIRRATLSDVAALKRLFRMSDLLHHQALPDLFRHPKEAEQTRESVADGITLENNAIFVAERHSQVVGFVYVGLYERDHPLLTSIHYAHIHEITVDKPFRGSGLAGRLMDEAERWALAKGASEIHLNVFQFNQRAIAFYRKSGYAAISQRMRKIIDASPETQI